MDLGCGTGALTYELTQKAGTVIGIDDSEAMIQKARGVYPQIEFQVMDACRTKWQDYFNVIWYPMLYFIGYQITYIDGKNHFNIEGTAYQQLKTEQTKPSQ